MCDFAQQLALVGGFQAASSCSIEDIHLVAQDTLIELDELRTKLLDFEKLEADHDELQSEFADRRDAFNAYQDDVREFFRDRKLHELFEQFLGHHQKARADRDADLEAAECGNVKQVDERSLTTKRTTESQLTESQPKPKPSTVVIKKACAACGLMYALKKDGSVRNHKCRGNK